MIDITQLTIGQAREIAARVNSHQDQPPPCDVSPWKIGANYFIRTVTYHHTGRLAAITQHEIVLEQAAWIADDGRFENALRDCCFAEVEMFPAGQQVIVGRAAIVDAVQIKTLPTTQV